ncbi:MAG: glutamate--tRNA ligase [Calditrichaeota bacterium]|nr:glutamate--tRNA ligase [Calditrichota bacterium]
MSVRVRFAPSPTGFLHVGGLRTALFNYLFARQRNGKFILRIEDTDQNRLVEGAVENLLEVFNWLRLSFDEGPHIGGEFGPYVQSERLEAYRRHAQRLLAAGRAYRCFCTPQVLETMRADQAERGSLPMYDRRCRRLDAETSLRRAEAGEGFVIRLAVPTMGTIHFDDLVRGQVSFQASALDDQVLLKSDGFPTYHLANVVDDHLMQISHVIRGEEWLSSTPKHILLYQFFGWETPAFAHLPLLLNPDRTKLSKRSADVAVEDYRDNGILPDALLNFVALLGWHPKDEREIFSLEELVKEFELERVGKAGAIFDITKLRWLNSEYLKRHSDEELFAKIRPLLPADMVAHDGEARLRFALSVVRPGAVTYREVAQRILNLFSPTPEPDSEAAAWIAHDNAHTLLSNLHDELARIPDEDWTNFEAIGSAFKEKCRIAGDAAGLKGKELWKTVRAALTGRLEGPELAKLIAIWGKQRVLAQLERAIPS